jgi:hypothetical protein
MHHPMAAQQAQVCYVYNVDHARSTATTCTRDELIAGCKECMPEAACIAAANCY